MGETWDEKQRKYIDMPKEMMDFLADIKEVCEKHNLSISHEDGHGAFIIEEYRKSNLEWLYDATKNF